MECKGSGRPSFLADAGQIETKAIALFDWREDGFLASLGAPHLQEQSAPVWLSPPGTE